MTITSEVDAHGIGIRRLDSVLTVTVDATTVLTDASTATIEHVVLFAVRYRNAEATYPFGDAAFGSLVICPGTRR